MGEWELLIGIVWLGTTLHIGTVFSYAFWKAGRE